MKLFLCVLQIFLYAAIRQLAARQQFLAFCAVSCYNSIEDENFNEFLWDLQCFPIEIGFLGFFAVAFRYTALWANGGT